MSDTPEPIPDNLPLPASDRPETVAEVLPDAPPDAIPEAAPAKVVDLPPAVVAARLGELFPALFGPGGPKPIKLRIQADIQQRAPGLFTKKALSIFLHRHTTSTPYLRALVAAPTRFDLDGEPAGEMLDEHRAAATVELERRRELMAARRAAERDAQRAAQAAQRQETGPEAGASAPAHADRPARPPRRREEGPRPPRRAEQAPGPGRGNPRPDRGRPQARQGERRVDGPASLPMERAEPPPREALPEDEGQRQRVLLLRAWEASPLTKANFCALKGLAEADFDAQVARAQEERKLRGTPVARDARR